jgi:hypothetical protein
MSVVDHHHGRVKRPWCCLFRGVPWGGEGDYLLGACLIIA